MSYIPEGASEVYPSFGVDLSQGVVVRVAFIQGGGAGAYDEDASLAGDLQDRLGPGIRVSMPRMPDEDDPQVETWVPAIRAAIEGADAVVAHSIGGYLLLRALAGASVPGLRAVFLIAVPFPSGDADWTFDGFELPDDFATSLPTRVFLYASEDDDVVPFAHRDLYAAAIPFAVARTTTGGHQLAGDLGVVADDLHAALT